MEKKMETTTVLWGVYRGYIGNYYSIIGVYIGVILGKRKREWKLL